MPPPCPALALFVQVPGWAEQLVGLGDRLFESDHVPAAHAMFLVAGVQVELPTTKGARLILPGVDHKQAAHRCVLAACRESPAGVCYGWVVGCLDSITVREVIIVQVGVLPSPVLSIVSTL